MSPSAGWSGRSRLLMGLLVAGALALAALRIVDYAFIPPDDALRHAATAVSERPYTEVVLFDEDVPAVDTTPGWHALLRALHGGLGFDRFALVSFSVFGLFLVFAVVPLTLLRRPEAWGMALLLGVVINPGYPVRLAFGRPFLLTTAALLVFVLVWDRLVDDPRDRRTLALCAGAAAVATWLHSTWFLLYAVPLASLLSGRRRASASLFLAVTVGVGVGALLTLQPLTHLSYQVVHVWKTMGTTPAPFRTSELQPFAGDALYLFLGLLLLLARAVLPELRDLSLRHAGVLTLLGGWVLGFVASRFWTDLGLPALLAVTALALQRVLEARTSRMSGTRWVLGAATAAALYLAISANHARRWEASPLFRVRSFLENPVEMASWLPGPGGIMYNTETRAFHTFYFAFPDAPWRYVLGPEQGIMPREDRETLHAIYRGEGWEAYEPWLEKLGPEDRIFFTIPPGADPPRWEGIEVVQVPRSYAVARLASVGRGEPPPP